MSGGVVDHDNFRTQKLAEYSRFYRGSLGLRPGLETDSPQPRTSTLRCRDDFPAPLVNGTTTGRDDPRRLNRA